jgi:hypothetical protein
MQSEARIDKEIGRSKIATKISPQANRLRLDEMG